MNKIKNSCFDEYIKNISMNKSEEDRIISSHKNVKSILEKSELNEKIYKIRLVGSYSRNTNTKTLVDDNKKIDVDIAVIFHKDAFNKPQSALDKIYSILELDYADKLKRQKRSIGIELSKTHVDVVPFLCVEDNSDSPLLISNKNKLDWDLTDPIGHIEYFSKERKELNSYLQYVKAFKWWKKVNKKDNQKFPIGIAIEEMILLNYCDSNNKFEGFLETLKKINDSINENYLNDPLIEHNNLFSNMNDINFNEYKINLSKTIDVLTEALENRDIGSIRDTLGQDFPKCEIYDDEDKKRINEKTKGLMHYASDSDS